MQNQPNNALPLIRGKLQEPQRVVIYGPEGVGKTSFAAQFPEPVFLDTEGGTIHLDVTRFPKPTTWEQVTALVEQLRQNSHPFQTLVVDTVDWLERLLADYVCRRGQKKGIEDFGFGKGYTYLAEEFSGFLQSLEALRERGMHILMVAHSTIRKFEQPDASGSYDRYELKLTKQCAPLLKEWCDLLLFANYFTKLTEQDGKQKAVGGKERRLHTTHCAAFDAKNRHGLDEVLPMRFEAIAAVIPAGLQPSAAQSTTQSAAPQSAGQGEPEPATGQQVQSLKKLWERLGAGAEEQVKLFKWLDAETLEGAESWEDLSKEQAARAIAFITRKLNEKGAAA